MPFMRPIARTLRLTLLAATLAATPAFAQTTTERTPSPTAQPAGPLGLALSTFAAQRGVALSFDPALTEGRRAPALPADFSTEQGFARLLAGTGLRLQARAGGSFTLVRGTASGSNARSTQPLRIGGQLHSFRYAEGLQLDEDYIHAQVSGNGDIGSLLRINPAVQFDNARLSAFTPGDITPANISINGAPFYQNAFVVDGMNFNNDIDPGGDPSPYRLAAAPGNSQAFALDTDLLADLTVLDSNVPAAYGGFSGGVIDAHIRRPKDTFSGSLSYQTTRSSWTRYNLDASMREDYENASAWGDGQPEFTKETWRATLEGRVTDRLGVLANFTRKRSTIPTYFYSAHLVDSYGTQREVQRQQSDQAMVKAVWDVSDRLTVDATVTHAPTENQYFRSNIRGAGIRIDSGGTMVNVGAGWQADWGTFNQRLSWSRTEQSRDAESDDYYTWLRSASKDWGTNASSLEGEFGDIEQSQRRLQYSADVQSNPLQMAGGVHRFSAGIALMRDTFDYRRLTENSTYTMPARTTTCTLASGAIDQACDMGLTATGWPGQYFTRRTRYATGHIGFDVENYAVHLDDDMRYGNVSIRPGLRIERDSYIGQTTIAPRFALSWEPREGTVLTAGANRYYGRSMAAWKLRDGVNLLRYNTERRTSLNGTWNVGTQAGNDTYFDIDKVGYADELMLGWRQDWAGLRFNLKAVNRRLRDQVIGVSGRITDVVPDDDTLTSSYTTWSSSGEGLSNIYSLTAQPLQGWTLAGTHTQALLSLDWTDVRRAVPLYDDSADAFYLNPWIRYDGRYMRYQHKPADNYTRPWSARLNTITRIEALDLTLTNMLVHTAGYRRIARTAQREIYQGEAIEVWEERTFTPSFTWNVRLAWERDLPAQVGTVYANIDITNVLNRRNIYGVSPSVGNAPLYDIGRQFWLEVGYRF